MTAVDAWTVAYWAATAIAWTPLWLPLLFAVYAAAWCTAHGIRRARQLRHERRHLTASLRAVNDSQPGTNNTDLDHCRSIWPDAPTWPQKENRP